MKEIVILERVNGPSDYDLRVAFRLTVPAHEQRFCADADATSAYKDAAAETVAALKAGELIEVVEVIRFTADAGGPPANADMVAEIEARYNAMQAQVNLNQYVRYGSCRQDGQWSVQGLGT